MPQPQPVSAVNLPVFHYTITLKDDRVLECDASFYEDRDDTTVFEDSYGTVRSVLRVLIAHVGRSGQPVGSQEVEKS